MADRDEADLHQPGPLLRLVHAPGDAADLRRVAAGDAPGAENPTWRTNGRGDGVLIIWGFYFPLDV